MILRYHSCLLSVVHWCRDECATTGRAVRSSDLHFLLNNMFFNRKIVATNVTDLNVRRTIAPAVLASMLLVSEGYAV